MRNGALGRARPASNFEGVELAEKRKSFWQRHQWILWAGGALLALLLVMTATVAVIAHRIEPFLRARIVDGLSNHFHARVELDSFHVAIGNGLHGEWGAWAQGRGLRIWPSNQPTGTELQGGPLFRLEEFHFNVPLRYKPGVPVYISQVRLRGLNIRIPPRSHLHIPPPGSEKAPPLKPSTSSPVQFTVGSIECTNADLVIGTDKPGKLPKEFAIPRLKISNLMAHGPVHFEAALTNPVPVGTIQTTGTFGPWQVDDPGESPVGGDYSFNNADLGSIKGIAGILNSTGRYQGTLRNITVDGVTDTADFRLSNSDTSLPLHTNFHAIVDGTDGDTWLDPVDATLGQSRIVAKGQVVRVIAPAADLQPHSIGHDIALQINISQGRIEDFLRISVKGNAPALTGNVAVKTTLHIPPGPLPVVKKMSLTNGTFSLTQAQFTSSKVQDKIAELSFRGQGRPHDAKAYLPNSIQADMRGGFKLGNGTLALSSLVFTVPGADIELAGTYGLDSGALNFNGVARLEATVSKIVGGWKGVLLKPADPFFKKQGAGTAVGIHIRGTRKDPEFGIDIKHKSTSPERPGERASPEASSSPPPA
jgi:hypothetical protein